MLIIWAVVRYGFIELVDCEVGAFSLFLCGASNGLVCLLVSLSFLLKDFCKLRGCDGMLF